MLFLLLLPTVLCCDVYSERTYVVYGNIMYDRRVIRGNTYAQQVIPTVRSLLLTYLMSAMSYQYFVSQTVCVKTTNVVVWFFVQETRT